MGVNTEMNRVAFGRRLYTIRRERQITSERLSELCEVNAVFIRQIENASRLPSLPVFVRLCNKLRVAPNFFLTDSLLWNEEDEIAALDMKLRTLSPSQSRTVINTIHVLIDELSKMEEPEAK